MDEHVSVRGVDSARKFLKLAGASRTWQRPSVWGLSKKLSATSGAEGGQACERGSSSEETAGRCNGVGQTRRMPNGFGGLLRKDLAFITLEPEMRQLPKTKKHVESREHAKKTQGKRNRELALRKLGQGVGLVPDADKKKGCLFGLPPKAPALPERVRVISTRISVRSFASVVNGAFFIFCNAQGPCHHCSGCEGTGKV